jgi:hypothetical protein
MAHCGRFGGIGDEISLERGIPAMSIGLIQRRAVLEVLDDRTGIFNE